MQSKKQQTVDAYNQGAVLLAKKFNNIGPRTSDIEKAFSLCRKKRPRVVELGCGNGREAAEILKLTDEYLGIDISEHMILLARASVPHGKFIVADMESYALPKNTKIFFAFASFLHLNKDSVAAMFKKMYTALAEDGIVYLSVKRGSYHEEMKKDEFGSRAFYFYTADDIRRMTETQYKAVYANEQTLLGVEWLEMALQKK